MKKRYYFLFLLIIPLIFLSIRVSKPMETKSEEARYTQKIVSVVYDDSGSMASEDRVVYARYSLKMLISLLGQDDVLDIILMNVSGVVNIDLANPNRQGQVDRITTNNGFAATGTTPYSSVGRAISNLVDRGMKRTSEVVETDSSKEYWLVILTDGSFDGLSSDLENDLKRDISGYSGLKTIYMGLGSSAARLENTDLTKNYPVTAYSCKDSQGAIDMMNSVANQISGKLTLKKMKDDAITISNNEVRIDLNKADVSIKSISVTAQKSGTGTVAAIQRATYKGQDINILNQASSQERVGTTTISANTFQLMGNPLFGGGEIVLTYSSSVSNVSVLIEPALRISPYLQYKDGNSWVKTDMQYVNSNFTQGDKVKVNFDVFEQGSSKTINLNQLFGDANVSVTYAGKSYNVDDEISLVNGRNEVTISVSLMNGAYYLSSSFMCVILDNPTYFRIESSQTGDISTNTPSFEGEYTVFDNNMPIDQGGMSGYTYQATLTNPNGVSRDVTPSLQPNGKLKITADLADGGYGEYILKVKVTSKDPDSPFSREVVDKIKYYPNSLEVKGIEDQTKTITSHDFLSADLSYNFELEADGTPMDFETSLISYKVEVNGKVASTGITVTGNKLSYKYDPADIPLNMSFGGDVEVKVSIDCSEKPTLQSSATLKTNVTPSVFTIEARSNKKESDIYKFHKSNALTSFIIYRDGTPLTLDELEEFLEMGAFRLKSNDLFFLNQMLCGIKLSVEELDGQAQYVYRVKANMPKLTNWLFGSFFFDKTSTITVSFNEIEAKGEYVYESPSFVSRLIRWIILIVIAIIIIYLVIYILGFFQLNRMLPTGMMIRVVANYDDYDDLINWKHKVVNDRNQIIKWHLLRLAPKLFGYQDSVSFFNVIKLERKKGKNAKFTFKDDLVEVKINGLQAFQSFRSNIQKSVRRKNCAKPQNPEIKNRDLINQIRRTPNKVIKGDIIDVSTSVYAKFNEEGNIEYIVFFTKK